MEIKYGKPYKFMEDFEIYGLEVERASVHISAPQKTSSSFNSSNRIGITNPLLYIHHGEDGHPIEGDPEDQKGCPGEFLEQYDPKIESESAQANTHELVVKY
ncbi:unnamed protein product [Allacma fusca]|uniref:Uncharacterized protein n=1 Tax=Allacma fusca TaxID=39272 RepID=A0A8J2PA31_9HEXA|nr:unnamed protein product [Allacma fusca]